MRSKISEHKRVKKKLIPPMATIPNGVHHSWKDDRLPEMLWAALIVTNFPRAEALQRLARVVRSAVEIALALGEEANEGPLLVTMSGIALLPADHRAALIAAATYDAASIEALRPLLLLESLPAHETWDAAIDAEPTDEDWRLLAKAIAACYDHQLQEATDCRWVRVAFALFSARITVAPETVVTLAEYPNHSEEEMRSSRPSIRSLEICFAGEWDGSDWAPQFWQECLVRTRCIPPHFDQEAWMSRLSHERLLADKEQLSKINQRLTNRFWETLDSTALDPQHEVAFGMALYAADLVTIAIALGIAFAPQGRMTLRALVECLITLRYLRFKNEPGLWAAFMAHGQGQAKLVSQRCEETGREPEYLDQKILLEIANDDQWTEFLPVELGHWGGVDLRTMAEATGSKVVYDDYYTWPSVLPQNKT